MDSSDQNNGDRPRSQSVNNIPDDAITQAKIGVMCILCVFDGFNLPETLQQQYGVSLPVANAYIDEHPNALQMGRDLLVKLLETRVPLGNGSASSLRTHVSNLTQNTPPGFVPVPPENPVLAPALTTVTNPTQPPSDEDDHLTEDNSSDDDEEVIDTDKITPQPPANPPPPPPPVQPPVLDKDKGKEVQRVPSPDPSSSPIDLSLPPVAPTYADRVKANPNHGQQKKKKASKSTDKKPSSQQVSTPTNNDNSGTTTKPPQAPNTNLNDKSTRTPAGRRPTFKETVAALKKRHPKGHPRILYFRFANPNDATNGISGLSNAILLDKFRTKCDIPVRYISANPEFNRYTVLPDENTNNDQQAQIQHVLASVIGCHAHQLVLSFYKYRVSLLFTNIKCIDYHIDGTTRLINPKSALINAVRRSQVQAWRDAEHLIDTRDNAVRWGPRAHGATTATLFVDILDNYSYKETRQLHDKVLQFDCGPRITHVAHVKPETVQCANCHKFGHPTIRCRSRPSCAICGNNHFTTDHVFVTVHNPQYNKVQCSNCSGPHHATNPFCPARPRHRNPAAIAHAQALREDLRNVPFNNPTNFQDIIDQELAASAGRSQT